MLRKSSCFVFLLVVTCLALRAEEDFQLSSLIVPQGVSYRFTPVRLTRDVKVETGTFDKMRVRATDASGNSNTNFVGQVVNEDGATFDSDLSRTAGASANAKAGIWTGFSASAEAHSGIEYGSKGSKHKSNSSSAKEDVDTQESMGYRRVDAVEETTKGSYGDWYLTFSGFFKNLDISDECYVKPGEGSALGAYVSGLSQPVFVPCIRQDMFAIGLDEVVCKFACPIHDEKLLSEIKSMDDKAGLSGLSVRIDGVSFPIISRATGKNVLNEIKLAEMKNPTTEFVLEVGDAKVLSPWKVRQRFGRASGKRGKNVTVREALEAINERVAEDDSMPEHVFEFDTNGTLVAVSETRLGEADGKNDVVLCARFDGNTAEASLHPLDAIVLDSPIKNYKKLEFIDLNMDEVVKLYNMDSQKYAHIYREVIKWLKAGKQDDRKVRLALGEFLLLSTNGDERRDGFNVLKVYWDKCKDISALEIMIYGYLLNTKEFPYREHVVEWISRLSKSEQWVQSALEKDILDALIVDGQTAAVVELSKLPSVACSSNGVTALMRIAASGNIDMAKAVLKACKYDVNAGNGEVGTALERAAKNDKVEMVKYLIGLGANPSLTFGNSEQYRNAVDEAAGANAVNVLKYLIEKLGCDAHKAHFCAAEQGALDAFQYLMEKCPINPNSKWDEIPLLSYAAWGGDVTICKCLIDKGASFDEIDGVEDYNMPISAAFGKKRHEVAEYLFDKGAKVSFYAIRSSFAAGDASWLKEKVSEKKINAGLVLLGAIELNNAEAVEYYAGMVDVNVGGPDKWLPLSWAAACNSVDAARVLVKMGAKVNHSLPSTWTPIQQACCAGSLDMVKYLIEECHVPIGDCPELAVGNKRKNILNYLLGLMINGESAIDINTSNYGCCTLLSRAALNGDNEMCEWLIARGAKLDIVDNKGWLPIERAVQVDKIDTVRFLVENYKLSRDTIEASAVVAAGEGSLSSLKYFINNCNVSPLLARKDGKRNVGFLLGEAAANGRLEIVRYLVEEKGVPVDFTPVCRDGFFSGSDFYSALHMAIVNGKQEVVEYLRSKGAKKE